MAAGRLRPNEVVDIPFTTWPQQWLTEQPKSWVWASNLRATEASEVASPDARGAMGEFTLPNNAGDHIEIIIVPMGEERGGEIRCEIVIAREVLGATDAMHLNTAVSQIMQMQRIDAADALCYLAQLYLMFRDWRRAREGLPPLLEEQPFLPLDMGSWTASQEELYAVHVSHPMAGVYLLLAFWFTVGGRWLAGFPGRRIADGGRPCYNQIPMRVLSPAGVASVYGVPQVSGGYEFRQSRNGWTITYAGHSRTYRRLKGFDYIAFLIECQGQEVGSTQLASIGAETSPTVEAAFLEEQGIDIRSRQTNPELQIDEQAMREIETDLEGAEDMSNAEMKELLERKEQLEDYLHSGTGRAGRSRSFGDDLERARKAVGKVIRYARRQLAVDLPELDEHLKNHLTTGARFMYKPDPEIDWIIDRAPQT